MIYVILNSLLWLWQTPQNILGYLYREFNSDNIIAQINTQSFYKAYLIRGKTNRVLGEYIFLNQDYKDKTDVLDIMVAKVIVSSLTGPFYFILLGMNSLFKDIGYWIIMVGLLQFSVYLQQLILLR